MTTLTRAEVEDITQAAAKVAVRETLLVIGVDIADPLKVQQEFAIMREVGRHAMDPEFRKDLEFARAWRLAMQSVSATSFKTAVGIVVAGMLGALLVGIQQILARGH